ncbi:MAG: DUF3662 domain-containing protein [Candidatus Eremiobacteraeota bacterium]|nr:DUF3662 domain-containing protein [Candidatus Eremiobacteraeota bacterium]
MSLFSRIEEACASLIERAFARTFPSDLEPAHIARKLVATMEAKASHEGQTIVAPGTYTVRVNGDDFSRLAVHRQYLEQEWAALIAEVARRVSIEFDEPPDVMLVEDSSVVPGAVEIDTASLEAPIVRRYRLRVVKGVPPDRVFPLDRTLAIGRSTTNDVILSDPRISRRHARIETSSGGPILVDLDSTNGTFVDGQRVTEPQRLAAGSVMTLGNTTLAIEEE